LKGVVGGLTRTVVIQDQIIFVAGPLERPILNRQSIDRIVHGFAMADEAF
jgi:hypothetical protein